VSTATAGGRRLEWDSEFFGVPIGQGEAETPAQVVEVSAWADRERLRCVYLLVPAGCLEASRAAEARGFYLTGVRMTWARPPAGVEAAPSSANVNVRTAQPRDVSALEAIAAGAHGDTRFYADGNFPRPTCDRLYATWIRRSCEGWADRVFAADVAGHVAGYITLHLRPDGEGVIGLVGVAEDVRRSGVGRALVVAALEWFENRQVTRVNVVTQAQNTGALGLYQRNGFSISRVDLWLHRWM
jgi:ribosomal protein S18 acetylase RimI-like enzyme